MSYVDDRSWSDGYIDQIKQIVGPMLLEPSSLKTDRFEATDLVVFIARDMRIAARLRRPGYFDRWPTEFTIRMKRDSGAETEHEKIMKGWGDWLFYGHTSSSDIVHWMIVDLKTLRAIDPLLKEKYAGCKDNGDGTYFRWYDAGKILTDAKKEGRKLIVASNIKMLPLHG